ncbi:anti-anti-sigma factor [Chromobacterium phragmitis]|uniref:Anti-anti-sigma factor n=2 Tax=Chromobacterium phragmitis TaxID=2202141 RepID=A0A344UDQ1_9NEIS|nr:STAS domain-containing protein [Chromobacterium phragmitis]AXE32010.1 anti-anti-sigma factor [Chromobacterium phragmitis]AXE33399.1 anti-anti-sigma factor [Chromobacterium phragmitis]
MGVKLNKMADKSVIAVEGRFDFEQHEAFRTCLDEALARGGGLGLEVDLSRVDYLESSALGMLLVMRDKAKAQGIDGIALTGARGFVRQILDVASFGKFFQFR